MAYNNSKQRLLTGGKSSAPRSLFEKARSETARHAGIFAARSKPFASGRLSRPLARPSAPVDSNAVKPSVQTSPVILRSHPLLPPASNSGIVVTSTTLKRPPDSSSSSSHSSIVGSSPPTDLPYPPPQPGRPLRTHHSPPALSPLFMPKHRTLSQLPSRAR